MEVVVAGLATLDMIAYPVDLKSAIEPGKLYPIQNVEFAAGGFVSNVAIGLARLGVAAAACAPLGADASGDIVVASLAEAGVDRRFINRLPHQSTAASVVLVSPGGERSFLFAASAGAEFDVDCAAECLKSFPSLKWFLFGYYSLFESVDQQLEDLFRMVRAAGVQTLLESAGTGGGMTPLCRILPWVDCFLPSFEEARNQTGRAKPEEMIACFRDHGAVGVVGVKLGAAGALVSLVPGEMLSVPALAVGQQVVDTTGAGDAFIAGFVAGRSRGFSHRDALRIAAAASASCVSDYGATRGLRGWEATRELALSDLH